MCPKAALTVLTTAALSAAAAAQDHNHITVDSDGSKIILDTGYLPDEEQFSIDADGWVLEDGQRLMRESIAEWTGTPLTGWQLGSETVLTSDFYAPTGRIDGGDFWYEIVAFDRLWGDGTSDFAWAQRDGGELDAFGVLSGLSREDRSFRVGFSGHPHSQVWLAEQSGRYQVSIVAWDANGVYADSDPIHFYVHSVPAPGALGLLALSGLLGARRRRVRTC